MHNDLIEFNSVKGFLDHKEGIFLYELTKRYCIDNFAVEIGSYCGKSACYIGQACKENKTYLITIDHHRGSEEQQYGEEYFDPEEYDYEKNRVDTLPTLLKNISRHELEDFVKPIVDNSQSASMKIKDGIDLLFIDGTFYNKNEIQTRDVSKIPHPEIIDTINKLSHLDDKEKQKEILAAVDSALLALNNFLSGMEREYC